MNSDAEALAQAQAAGAALAQVESDLEDILTAGNVWIAAGDGHLAEVQRFVAAGVPGGANAQDESGYTPL